MSNTCNSNNVYQTQNDVLLSSIMEFYQQDGCMEKMLKIITGEHHISLGLIDWFVTNYAKKYFTIYYLDKNDTKVRFKVYIDYKLNLDSYSKARFDPFCRWERISVPYKNGPFFETTIGQLNFFRWAIQNKVIDYIQEHYDEIKTDMNSRNSTSKRKKLASESRCAGGKTRKKREELSISATKSVKKEDVEIVVNFH